MARQAIRNEGNQAENKFVELVNGASISEVAALGDVIVSVDGVEHYVEIKQCGTRSGTINQVRAIKYIPRVVWASLREKWYILPPNRLVRVAAGKERGQHTEIPFECMNLGMPVNAGIPHAMVCEDHELSAGIREAILEGERLPECRERMRLLLQDICELRERCVSDIEALFDR